LSSTTPPIAEGCPPPLNCRDVWAAVEREATAWRLPRPGYALRGWTLGSGPPLYFVNGFAGRASLFCLTAWLLRDRVRSVMYDVELGERAGPQSLADFSADLLDAATRSGDRSFAVFGATFGGTVALQAALAAPERVERLILLGVPARGTLTWVERLLAMVCLRSRRPLAKLPGRLTVQTHNHRRWFPPVDPDRWRCFLEMTGPLPAALAARQALALGQEDLRPQLAEVRQPVLLIETEGAGRRLAAAQDEVRRGLPNARVEPLHATGLHPYLTHPHRLVKLIQSRGLEG
jgi:pimeloyl-ACP methyl ester carboxylesterase